MGLIRKTAVLIVLSILSQTVCCSCMPRKHSKSQLKSNAKHIYSQNDKSTKNTALLNNLTTTNNFETIRFPNVEYPFDSDLGEYYRFINDYHVQCRPNEYTSNSSCQVETNKIETKYKRKLDRVSKAKSQITTSFTEHDSEASFFPEVEYPLSARDMWIPKYKSRLQDINRSGDVEIDRTVDRIASKNTFASNNEPDYKYEVSALSTLIKTLNTKETQVTETPIHVKGLNTSESGDILDVTVSNTPSEMTTDSNPGPPTSKNGSHGYTFTTVNTNNNVIDSKVFRSHEDRYKILYSNPTSMDNSHVFNSMVEAISNSDNNSQISLTDEDKGSHVDTQPQMLTTADTDWPSMMDESARPMPRNLSRPIDKIYTECTGITITPDSNPSTTIFTPLDYCDSFSSMISDTGYSDLTDIRTVAPFEYVTSPMSSSGTLSNNIVLDQSTTTAPNLRLTTTAPSPFNSAPTNSHQDYSIVANDSPQNFLDNDQGNFTHNWSINPNDSYTTCRLAEDSDDWVIYVDTGKTITSRENYSDYTLTADEDILLTYVDGLNGHLGEKCQISRFINSTLLIITPDGPGDENNKLIEVLPKNIPIKCPVLNVTNVRTITETRNVDKSNSLTSSWHSCPSSTSTSTQAENYQSRDIPTNSSIKVPTAPEHMDDSWILVNDTENITQSLEGHKYKSVKNNTSEESISTLTNDRMDQFLYLEDLSSTFQYEYIDDASASVTEVPYDLVL